MGLKEILNSGGKIYRAFKSMPWPGVAGVNVAVVHAVKREWLAQCVLDDCQLSGISASLDTTECFSDPYPLATLSRRCLQGTIVLGEGFFLTATEAMHLLKSDERNKAVVKPFLDGEAIVTSPSQAPPIYVIDFSSMSESEAASFTACFARLRSTVYPERLEKSKSSSYKDIMKKWWQFWRTRDELYEQIKDKCELLIAPVVAKYISFSFVPTGLVYGNKSVVIPTVSRAVFAVLQSSFHLWWSDRFSTTLGMTYSYTPTTCFETMPLPAEVELTEPTDDGRLSKYGTAYLQHRQYVMTKCQHGLTDLYNRFHSPDETSADIQKLRDLHVEMDNAVAAAYGWPDLKLDHGFHETKQGIRFTISEPARREVLQRLLKLNHERYAEEEKQGLHGKKKIATKKASKPASKSTPKKKKAPNPPEFQQPSLFDEGEVE